MILPLLCLALAVACAALYGAGRYRLLLPDADRRTLDALAELPLVIWQADREGNVERVTLSVGGGLAAYGVEPGELVGKTLQAIHSDGSAASKLARIRGVIESGQPDLVVAPGPTHDGGTGYYISYIAPVRGGKVLGVSAVTMDVTGLVEARQNAEHAADILQRRLTRTETRARAAEQESEALRMERRARAQFMDLMTPTGRDGVRFTADALPTDTEVDA